MLNDFPDSKVYEYIVFSRAMIGYEKRVDIEETTNAAIVI